MISSLVAMKQLTEQRKRVAAYNAVMQTELNLGGLWICSDGKPYWADGISRRVIPIDPKNAEMWALLTTRYALTSTDTFSRHVVSVLEAFTIAQGARRALTRFAHYDGDNNVLHLSRYDGTSYRIAGDGNFDIIPNGAGALFVDDDGGIPCQPIVGPHGVFLPTVINDLNYADPEGTGLAAIHQRRLFAIWALALPFASIIQNGRPVLLVTGEHRSGKTSAVQRLQIVVRGAASGQQIGEKSEDDFGVTIMRDALALVDNLDTHHDWLDDALCAMATGVGWRRRKKFSNTKVVEIKPKGWIAITTRRPQIFHRPDVADRLLILKLRQRRAFNADMLASAFADRSRLYGEYLWYLNAVVARLRQPRTPNAAETKHRLAGFARFAFIAGEVLGFTEEEITESLDAAQIARNVLTTEGDPVADLLDIWLENLSNIGREVRPQDLLNDLQQIGAKRNVTLLFRTGRSLALRLRECADAMAKTFEITVKDLADGNQSIVVRRAV